MQATNPLPLFACLIVATTGLIGFATGVSGQDYPNRPVKILVGYPPSSAPDVVARTVGEALSLSFGQTFVVENKPGAGGVLATELTAKAAADGYTLLSGETGQLEIAPNLFKALPYDTLRDLTPVGMVYKSGVIFATNSKSQIRTIKELVREAKASPGKLNYGSSGVGSIHHIIFEAFNAAAGIKMTHIPFKASALTLPALLAGDVDVMMGTTALVPHMRSGAINLLGVTSYERYPLTPAVPPIAEDLNGFDFASEGGILAPAGVAPDVLAKLSKAMKAATETPKMQEQYAKLGAPGLDDAGGLQGKYPQEPEEIRAGGQGREHSTELTSGSPRQAPASRWANRARARLGLLLSSLTSP